MEDVLDQIAAGKTDWKQQLNQFFADFSTKLSQAELDELEGGMNQIIWLKQYPCPSCGRPMAIRTAVQAYF